MELEHKTCSGESANLSTEAKRISSCTLLEFETSLNSRKNYITNVQKWALTHNRPRESDSVVTNLADYYDHDKQEFNRRFTAADWSACTWRIHKMTETISTSKETK